MADDYVILPWPEPWLPQYRAGKYGAWSCKPTPKLTRTTTGYFRFHRTQQPGWMIRRKGTIWMSLAAMECESHMPHIAAARGHVVVAGLGMGFVTFNIMRKPEVTKVTVLERDREVIKLMDQISDWRSWPKIELVEGDALAYQPNEPVDFLYADIWSHLGDEQAPELTQAIQANVQAARVGWWGQELDFFGWCQKKNLAPLQISDRNYRAFVRDSAMPVIGAEWPGYARLAAAASVMAAMSRMAAFAPHERDRLLVAYSALVA